MLQHIIHFRLRIFDHDEHTKRSVTAVIVGWTVAHGIRSIAEDKKYSPLACLSAGAVGASRQTG